MNIGKIKEKLLSLRIEILAGIRTIVERDGEMNEYRKGKVLRLREPIFPRDLEYSVQTITAALLIDAKGYEKSITDLTTDELVRLLEVVSPKEITPQLRLEYENALSALRREEQNLLRDFDEDRIKMEACRHQIREKVMRFLRVYEDFKDDEKYKEWNNRAWELGKS